ncbi:MAG: glucose 1-dehydrogenase [Alphaproteobacteria bacterium]|nr:glucose 1-dehydrogenase [Alphaproteobacteria bacterium]MCB9930595.1 glucose 1-dehydrogenase [Alphaproteobacteria bacterium]
MSPSLDGKVAIVTGAFRGLGRAYAEGLAREGAAVVCADVRYCDDTVAGIVRAGGKAVAATCDVTDMAACQAMADLALERYGRVDVLVNNAALYANMKGGKFDQLEPAEWQKMLDVNVTGMWHCCKAVIEPMRKQKSGSIINISSLAAVYGFPFGVHYAMSKGAVIGMTRAMAREIGRDFIRVNAVAPSAVMTEGTKEFFGERLDKAAGVIAGNQALQRSLEADDLVGTIVYLASDASKFVTGQTIMVDGGTVFL